MIFFSPDPKCYHCDFQSIKSQCWPRFHLVTDVREYGWHMAPQTFRKRTQDRCPFWWASSFISGHPTAMGVVLIPILSEMLFGTPKPTLLYPPPPPIICWCMQSSKRAESLTPRFLAEIKPSLTLPSSSSLHIIKVCVVPLFKLNISAMVKMF